MGKEIRTFKYVIGKKNAKTSEWGNSFALLTKRLTNQAKFTQRTLETSLFLKISNSNYNVGMMLLMDLKQ